MALNLHAMNDLKLFFQNKKSLAGVIIFLLILVSIPLGLFLVQKQQIFKSRASTLTRPFDIIENTTPQKPAECDETTCTINSLNIIIKPNIGVGESNEPIQAIIK